MDYLVIEGYKSAAEEFAQEASVVPEVDFESIESRMRVREALQRGDVEDAIVRVNELNPEVSVSVSMTKGALGITFPFLATTARHTVCFQCPIQDKGLSVCWSLEHGFISLR